MAEEADFAVVVVDSIVVVAAVVQLRSPRTIMVRVAADARSVGDADVVVDAVVVPDREVKKRRVTKAAVVVVAAEDSGDVGLTTVEASVVVDVVVDSAENMENMAMVKSREPAEKEREVAEKERMAVVAVDVGVKVVDVDVEAADVDAVDLAAAPAPSRARRERWRTDRPSSEGRKKARGKGIKGGGETIAAAFLCWD